MEVVPEVQVPPTVEEENVVVALLQTDWVPDKVPATGAAVMITDAIVVIGVQPVPDGVVYVTVQVFAELALGVIAPVLELMLKPVGLALYVPLAVPTRVTDCALVRVLQNGELAYEIVADGSDVIVTLVVAVIVHPVPEGAVQVTVKMPAELVLGIIAPVLELILKPVGLAL